MIVVDTNIIVNMTFPAKHSSAVNSLHEKDSVWEAPVLWKTEFLNVLSLYFRKGILNHSDGLNVLDYAERLIGRREHRPDARQVIEVMANSTCSSYSCEFVALARQLGTQLITYDKKLLSEFTQLALTPEQYLEQ